MIAGSCGVGRPRSPSRAMTFVTAAFSMKMWLGSAMNERPRHISFAVSVGSIVSAFLAAACCAGPLIFALLGVGGVGFLVKFNPYRPYFTAATIAFLAAGFYLAYGRPNTVHAAEVGRSECGCPAPRTSRTGRIGLWIATLLALGFLSSSYIAPWLVD